jgi:photosystem II stability/assembly factor-like uncharacterized protein
VVPRPVPARLAGQARLAAAAVVAVAVLAPGAPALGQPAAVGQRPTVAAVPAGFRVQSISWPAPAQGWALGAAPCPGGDCTVLASTADGGSHWSTVAAPPAPLAPSGAPGVTSIRFADAQHGWAFGPSFYATSDGGRSWQRAGLPGGGRQALALAAAAGLVYLAVSPCALDTDCTQPPTVWAALVGRPVWRRVPTPLPVAATQVVLAARGSAVYVLATQVPLDPDLFYASTDAGLHWSLVRPPCVKEQDESLVDVVPVAGTEVALLCVGDPGRSRAIKHVFRSPDAGMTTVDAGVTPTLGIQSRLAATTGTLLVSSVSAGDWLYRNAGGQKWDTALDLADGGLGWNDPIFTTSQTGYLVYGPAAASADRPGILLRTDDAGQTWAPVAFTPATGSPATPR